MMVFVNNRFNKKLLDIIKSNITPARRKDRLQELNIIINRRAIGAKYEFAEKTENKPGKQENYTVKNNRKKQHSGSVKKFLEVKKTDEQVNNE